MALLDDAIEDGDSAGAPCLFAFLVSCIVFGLGEGLVPLIAAFTRREALRVDEEGVTLACAPLMLTQHGLWWRTPTVKVFWHEIDAVVLFRQADKITGSAGARPQPSR